MAEAGLKEAWVPVVVACLSVDVNFVALGASVVSRVSPGRRNLKLSVNFQASACDRKIRTSIFEGG